MRKKHLPAKKPASKKSAAPHRIRNEVWEAETVDGQTVVIARAGDREERWSVGLDPDGGPEHAHALLTDLAAQFHKSARRK